MLELFQTDGRSGSWRVHAATVVRWELGPRRKVVMLKVFLTDRFHESVLIGEDLVPDESIMAEVDSIV